MSQPEAQVSGSELPVDEQCSSLSKVVRRKGGKFCSKSKASRFRFKKAGNHVGEEDCRGEDPERQQGAARQDDQLVQGQG